MRSLVTFTFGYLAIIGVPPSGFWSKDKIIETALADSWLVGGLAIVGAGITGFYMTRLMIMIFFSDKRWKEGAHPRVAEGDDDFAHRARGPSALGGLMLPTTGSSTSHR
jgi:NADH-quinone oxidoreductase subunit L